MTTLSRRALLGAGAALPLAGCGFHPVYMPSAGGEPGVAERELAAIYVAIIPDRPGQELRQALQQRLEGTGADPAPLYTLTVNYWTTGEGIAIQPDTSVTRIRLFGNANWRLNGRDPGQTLITGGFARAEDAVNVIDAQYFSSDLQTEASYRYLAEALANQITTRLAIFFRNKAGLSG
jgi:LPS-assembly lipoprotein